MRFKKRNLLLLGLIFVLTSCGDGIVNSESGAAPSSSSEVRSESLSVESKATAFYQYDKINYGDFLVKDSDSKMEIDHFEIFLNDERLLDQESRLLTFGKVRLTFRSMGYSDSFYEINVKKSSNLQQFLLVETPPKKTAYKKGESFQKEGLKVSFYLSYTKQNRDTVNEKTDCESYRIEIDGVPIDQYVFDENGYALKYALITASDIEGNPISTSLPLFQEETSSKNEKEKFVDETEKYDWVSPSSKMKVRFSNSNVVREKAYYSPEEINLDFNLNAFMNKDCTNFRQTPSLGEVPLLVVPVILNGFENMASEENHRKIEKAFFGKTSGSDDLPTNSLSSYYYYSSFKQLKFVGEVTPFFNPTEEGYMGYSNPYNFTTDTPSSLAKDALNWAKEKQHINLDDYDSDNDGFVDGVWLIYMEDPNSPFTGNVSAFWPFTTASITSAGTKENPSLNTFAWAGTAHLWGNRAIPEYVEKEGVDPHVLLHETGHMLGLNDYYSYQSASANELAYSPLGKQDMMDQNFGDHNPYSKMLLGWIKPYLVLGDSEIEIPSSQIENSVFFLPYDEKTYQKDDLGRVIINPFDEYLLLDYYTYENLYQDNFTQYQYHFQYPTEAGGRLYHIDARALEYYGNYFVLPKDPDEVLTSSNMFYRCITNSQAGTRAESNYKVNDIKDYFDEVRLIAKNNVKIDGNNIPNGDTFFKVGDTFKLTDYASQFYEGRLDNQKTFSTEFTIVSLD